MAGYFQKLMDRVLFGISLRRWAKVADNAPSLGYERLRQMRTQARQMRREVDRVIHTAEYRLGLPLIGREAIRKINGTDWAWRPDLWQGRIENSGTAVVPGRYQIGEGTTLFHDCGISELSLRQIRNSRESDVAPFGFRMDVFGFDGSFLSMVLDLPKEVAQDLKLRHILRLDAIVELEQPLTIVARLNIKHGPNVEQIVHSLPSNGRDVSVEFDLAYTKLNEKRIEKLWVDLIFQDPQMNQIILRDLTLTRRPRAEL